MADNENPGVNIAMMAGPMMAGVNMIPNQANWAAMNVPNTVWRRSGRLIRTPSGRWRRDGRLYTVQ